jgi:hypothetical protein
MENEISLYEVLVKTSYQTQITLPEDKLCENPVGYGSGFIVVYQNEKFFITADHTLHIDDHSKENEKRTGKEHLISINNNYSPPENFLSTVVTPLGGFYFMEKFNIDKPDDDSVLIDITLCKMKEMHFQYPFLTEEIRFPHETIKGKEPKIYITEECFSEPKIDKNYFVFGRIRPRMVDILLHREHTIKENLKFISKSGDYLLFYTSSIITDNEDWEGLSGSPVLSEDGECVGVFCSVLKDSKSVWVMPIAMVKLLLEVAIKQEELKKIKPTK